MESGYDDVKNLDVSWMQTKLLLDHLVEHEEDKVEDLMHNGIIVKYLLIVKAIHQPQKVPCSIVGVRRFQKEFIESLLPDPIDPR